MLFFILLVCFLPGSTYSELLSRQKRNWIIDSFTIEEANPGPFPYELGKINIERDYFVYFDLFGEGVNKEPKDVLTIDKDTGMIYVHKAVDYETTNKLQLSFEAKKDQLTVDTRLGIEIQILDINDNAPVFDRSMYEITVNGDLEQGSHLLTVLAHDKDKSQSPNSTFHYNIKSVSPNSPDTEFYIKDDGFISFKGCLDYKVAGKRTILVEAIDHGDKVRLTGSTTILIHIQDSNNHLPVISGQTGSGKVNENESGTSPLRLHVTDNDQVHSKAWRAKYKIHNDGGYFKIETDPETNDGILTVVKPMNYEENATRELVISVENEAPYFFCKVKQKTMQGLWKVETSKDVKLPGDDGQPHSAKVMIQIEDVNDPPEFKMTIKDTALEENAPNGTWVEKLTAVDSDFGSKKSFIYKIANDPSGWVTVDPNTGDITTVIEPDRESPYVVNGIYTVLLHAVDDGNPPMTGTATLNIHVVDINDNLPQPTVSFVEVCLSDSTTTTNISAFDADGDPYGGPFQFELLGSAKENWKLKPSYGFTAGLVKEPSIQVGFYTIDLKISDLQGAHGIYSINVTVCTCSMARKCHTRARPTTSFTVAVVTAILVLVLLLTLLLAASATSCKKKFKQIPIIQNEGHMQHFNTEQQGTDCKVEDSVAFLSKSQMLHNVYLQMTQHHLIEPDVAPILSNNQIHHNRYLRMAQHHLMVPDDGPMLLLGLNHDSFESQNQYKSVGIQLRNNNSEHYKRHASHMTSSSKNWSHRTSRTYRFDGMETKKSLYHKNTVSPNFLEAVINQKLSSLRDTEMGAPNESRLYSEANDANNQYDLEDIDLPEEDQESFQIVLENLGPSFRKLASICEPQNHNKNFS